MRECRRCGEFITGRECNRCHSARRRDRKKERRQRQKARFDDRFHEWADLEDEQG